MRGFYAFGLLLIITSLSDVNTLAESRNSSPKIARIPVPSMIVGSECNVVAASLRLSFLRSSCSTYPGPRYLILLRHRTLGWALRVLLSRRSWFEVDKVPILVLGLLQS
jgi:hypothetical protein